MESLEERLALSATPLGGLVEQHSFIDDVPLSQHVESQPDFWIDNSQETSFDEYLREIEQALAEAHTQTGLTQVRNDYGFTGSGQTVAVIDTGIAYDHFALGGGLGSNYRVVGGWDFAENDANPYDDGPSGMHGSHVSGIVGGDSGADTGVATGVDLVGLRVFDDGGNGYFTWVESALQWVHNNRYSFENPITAVNLSLGVAGWNAETVPVWSTLEDEFAQLEADGIFVSVSAGNSFTDYNSPGLSYPAASQYVVPVMSTDDSGLLSYYSQRSTRAIAAPGRTITSTVPDYAGNNNGVADDYATMSGTSMAAPYVAGASVIIREAMEFVGYTGITQDTIFELMKETATSVYDSATGLYFDRLDMEAAIDALMPTDEFGSTAATAYNLGTLSGTSSVSGVIGTLSDADYFTFTAGATGTVSLAATTTHDLVASWDSSAGGTLSDGGDTITLDVVAGNTYTVGLSSADGLGYFDIEVSTESTFTFTDWGAVAFGAVNGVAVSGEGWYRLQATNIACLTAEGFFNNATGQVGLELYDANLQLLDSCYAADGVTRVDAAAAAGEEFFLRVLGTSSDVDFRLTNLVSVENGAVTVRGTGADDAFAFVGGSTFVVNVNGVVYEFAEAEVANIAFLGGTGIDTISLVNLEGTDISLEGIEGYSDCDAMALTLATDLQLYQVGNGVENWGGWGERWLASESGSWYFITSTGNFYFWGGSSDLSTSTLVATLTEAHFNDLSLITEATASSFTISSEAASFDWNLNLSVSRTDYFNWGGWGEKWVRSENKDWYFITGTGDLYRWTGGTNLSYSEHVASLSGEYHSDLSKLYDASAGGSLGDALAGSLSQQLGLNTHVDRFDNWGGWNEKWIKSTDNQWYFITETGGLYRWDCHGGPHGSELVADLSSFYYENAELLIGLANLATPVGSVESTALDSGVALDVFQAASSWQQLGAEETAQAEIILDQSLSSSANEDTRDRAISALSNGSAAAQVADLISETEQEEEGVLVTSFDSAIAEYDPFGSLL